MPGRFVNTIGSEGSRATFQSTGDLGDIRNEGGHSDPELYKKRSAVERFFSWIEAFKKIVPRYERYEHSFIGLIHLACGVVIGRILGDLHSCASHLGKILGIDLLFWFVQLHFFCN